MYKHKGNGRLLELIKVEEGRHYFIDINTQEEVSYAESTFKRYIEKIGTTLVSEITINSNRYTTEEIYELANYHGLKVLDYIPTLYDRIKTRIQDLKEAKLQLAMGNEVNDNTMSLEDYNRKIKEEARELEAFNKVLDFEEGKEETTNSEYIILRQGNYVPTWMIGGKVKVEELKEKGLLETDGAGYHRGTYEVFDNENSKVKSIDKFNTLVDKFPQILEATSTKPIGVTKVGRDLAREFVLTGVVTLSPNGLYIKKKDLKEVTK